MENVVLVIHLILALSLIGAVLMQRSEGGGLGIGGGGGGGAGTGRAAVTAMGKLTWLLAIAFIVTSISLTILAANNAADASVTDGIGAGVPSEDGATDTLPSGDDLLPPGPTGDDALLPSSE